MIGRVNTGGGKGAALTVTAPAGATVTVSKDGKTLTRVAGADGVVVFRGLETGTWTLSITDGVHTSSKPVVITADYATVIAFFSATINITYPEGSSCTCSDGTTTFTAPDTSGTWACVVHNAGTWTISLGSGFAETVSITENGQTVSVDKWYLYDSGDERTYVTGGWDMTSKSEKHMTFNRGATGQNYTKGTINEIDVSTYNTLYMTVDENSYVDYDGTTKMKMGSASVTLPEFRGSRTISLDISGVTIGKCEINYSTGSIVSSVTLLNITKVWME